MELVRVGLMYRSAEIFGIVVFEYARMLLDGSFGLQEKTAVLGFLGSH